MNQPRILTVRPEPGKCAWAFGGAPPLARIAPGTVLDLYTEDYFDRDRRTAQFSARDGDFEIAPARAREIPAVSPSSSP